MAVVLAKDWKMSVGGSYDSIASQRDGTMTLSHAPVDATTKDSNNNRELVAAIHSWSFSSSFLIEEGDTGFDALWTAWSTKVSIACRFTTPGSATFTGTGFISDLSYAGPYNDMFSGTVTIEGTGALTKA